MSNFYKRNNNYYQIISDVDDGAVFVDLQTMCAEHITTKNISRLIPELIPVVESQVPSKYTRCTYDSEYIGTQHNIYMARYGESSHYVTLHEVKRQINVENKGMLDTVKINQKEFSRVAYLTIVMSDDLKPKIVLCENDSELICVLKKNKDVTIYEIVKDN